jgi:hypothetical protein
MRFAPTDGDEDHAGRSIVPNPKSNYRLVPPPVPARAVQDEWGLFDPEQAGMQAAVRTVREMKATVPVAAEVVTPPANPVPEADESSPDVSDVQPLDADNYGRHESGAVYRLEFATRCPHCRKAIKTFKVFRLLRTQVSFTSTLPRKGYVIVCPDCDGLLSTELSGLL